MDEILSQMGELLMGIAAALAVIGIVLLLLSNTNAGVLRIYVMHMLESAC